MGLLDFLQTPKIRKLQREIETLQQLLTPEQSYGKSLVELISQLETEEIQQKEKLTTLREECYRLEQTVTSLNETIQQKKDELVILDQELLLQEFGLYEPIYDFANSDQYKAKLEENRKKQKDLIKNKTGVSYYDHWTVDGSRAKGRKMNNDNIKQIIRTFNVECESIIDRLTFANVESMKKRINKSYDALNKMNQSNRVALKPNFLQLKLEELQLAYEYQVKKQEEKEEQRRIKEALREQARVQKELEEQRKNTLKDLKHFDTALQKLQTQLQKSSLSEEERSALIEKEQELAQKVETINEQLKDIDYRQTNQRAGYVYIISNIGAFGENIYKIGMTRRLEPYDRVHELGGASVPFRFDVHAMIFTEDAPALENALHKAFDSRRVNLVNARREFFHVTLNEIEEVVKNNFDKTVSFERSPLAPEFRETQRLRSLSKK